MQAPCFAPPLYSTGGTASAVASAAPRASCREKRRVRSDVRALTGQKALTLTFPHDMALRALLSDVGCSAAPARLFADVMRPRSGFEMWVIAHQRRDVGDAGIAEHGAGEQPLHVIFT